MAYRSSRNAKKEISFKASLFRFMTVFTVVLVAGLITNLYISRIDLKQYIPQEWLESEEFELTIDEPYISFRKGLFPVVGVVSPRVEWKDKKCSSRRVQGQEVFIVLDFFSLFKGQVKPGRVDIDFIEVTTPVNCSDSQPIVGQIDTSLSEENTPIKKTQSLLKKDLKVKQLEKFFFQIQRLEAIKTLPIVDIKKFTVRIFEGYREDAVLKGSFYFRRSQSLMARVVLNEAVAKGHELPLRNANLEFHGGLD